MSLTVDLTARMPKVMDQGPRPTCLVCAVSDAHQYLYSIVDALSVEALFHGCVQRDATALQAGATVACAGGALANAGQPEESSWPYQLVQPALDTWHDPAPASQRFKGTVTTVQPSFDDVSASLRASAQWFWR